MIWLRPAHVFGRGDGSTLSPGPTTVVTLLFHTVRTHRHTERVRVFDVFEGIDTHRRGRLSAGRAGRVPDRYWFLAEVPVPRAAQPEDGHRLTDGVVLVLVMTSFLLLALSRLFIRVSPPSPRGFCPLRYYRNPCLQNLEETVARLPKVLYPFVPLF